MSSPLFRTSLALLGLAAASSVDRGPAVADAIRFNRDVRPVLSENCFACHGPDKNKRKAGLRLDVREAAIDDGAIVPGDPEQSELIKRLTASHPDDLMPPPETRKVLKPDAVALLRRWVAEGAPYEPHWSYVPIKRPAPPLAQASSIDAFVRAALADKGVAPAAEADRGTLARRLYLDLVGLPATPEELRAFAADASPNAYEALVDRLLASPHFGERMAAPWLDVARFADTVGYHGDQNQHVFPYRDYVIASFNRNKPFDVFTREQLAGDLLPHAGTEAIVATGFNRLNMITREGGAQPREYLAKYMADRVRAVGGAWLGATVGCAECHDHKYDPITQKDFYSLGAFFADVTEWGVYHDYPYTPNPELKGWSNDHPFPPEITVASPYLARRAEKLATRLDALLDAAVVWTTRSPDAKARFAQWRADARRFLAAHPEGFVRLALPDGAVTTTGPNTLTIEGARTVRVDGPASYEAAVVDVAAPDDLPTLAALTLEALPHPAHGGKLVREPVSAKNPDEAGVVVRIYVVHDGKKSEPLRVHLAHATASVPRYLGGEAQVGVERGWCLPDDAERAATAVYELANPVELARGDRIVVDVQSSRLGAFRLAASPFAGFGTRATGGVDVAKRTVAPAALGRGYGRALASALARPELAAELFVASVAGASEPRDELHTAYRDLLETRFGRVPTVVTAARAPRTVRVLPRGNWQDDSGEIVTPATLHFLPAPPAAGGRRLTRLDLANWLTWSGNPLTARAVMNRLWKQFFGAGLAPVLDDLGAQGEAPSHPELLDWLAAEFIESGWDWKHMVRLIVTSKTYRQSSAARRELAELDPQNRLLARQTARRLEAEIVRDHALAVAGLLDLEIGGPSIHPYQPEGYWENIEFPKRPYVAERDERQHRRGLYTHWQRTFLHPTLANFDAPSREECTADRPGSNTPQQALTLLNDPTFVEAARVFAERLLARPGDDRARLARGFEQAVGRAPQPTELTSLADLLAAARRAYERKPDDADALLGVGIAPRTRTVPAPELAAWTQTARAMLNLYESITRL